jgi:16S rRNA G966 N2-methylase RsmD
LRLCYGVFHCSSGKEEESFDLIFIDPPYALDQAEELLNAVNNFGLLRTGGIICFETSGTTQLPDTVGSLYCDDCRKYGSTSIRFYKLNTDGDQVE